METKHTPGPWVVAGFPDNISYDAINANGPRVVAWVKRDKENPSDSDPVTLVEAKANARLIAAAPEMVELLRQVVNTLDIIPEDAANRFTFHFDLDRLNALLAKLDGEK